MPVSAKRTIGQVLPLLKSEFPDISISKIRFLEQEGLVLPERTASGYRRYSEADIDRLRYILTVQRDHYLPLKVIRENLEVMDQGLEPPKVETPSPRAMSRQRMDNVPSAEPAANKKAIKLTRRELLQVSGVSEATLIEMERQHMIMPRRGSMYYGREALTLCVVARKLQAYGMDTRHLRAIKQAAERESGLVEQAVAPHLGNRTSTAKMIHELSLLVVHAHAALMYTLLER